MELIRTLYNITDDYYVKDNKYYTWGSKEPLRVLRTGTTIKELILDGDFVLYLNGFGQKVYVDVEPDIYGMFNKKNLLKKNIRAIYRPNDKGDRILIAKKEGNQWIL